MLKFTSWFSTLTLECQLFLSVCVQMVNLAFFTEVQSHHDSISLSCMCKQILYIPSQWICAEVKVDQLFAVVNDSWNFAKSYSIKMHTIHHKPHTTSTAHYVNIHTLLYCTPHHILKFFMPKHRQEIKAQVVIPTYFWSSQTCLSCPAINIIVALQL